MLDVCLPLVPFARLEAPSLALGIFKSKLKSLGFSSRVLYPNLDFAFQIGIENYHTLSIENISLMGEWLFAAELFGERVPDYVSYFKHLTTANFCGVVPNDDLLEMRDRASCFIEELASRILSLNPKIVSCSSTFQQHTASLALLKKLKSVRPSLITIMGGANCESIMGFTTKRLFNCVDFVLSGEGDFLFPSLCKSLLNDENACDNFAQWDCWPGVFHRDSKPSSISARPTVENMDEISIPDYDDYFSTLHGHPLEPVIRPCLPVEASRGCWWGQQHHCTFCGLNGDGLAYRSKSPKRMYEELALLKNKYGNLPFGFVDNIVPREYFDQLFSDADFSPARLPGDQKIFFEVKANLTKQQVTSMKDSGVTWIQPGIESLHDLALRELKKGTTCLINIQLLRWAIECGISVSWSILTEFPGEKLSWLEEMEVILPLLHHLQPPMTLTPIQYHRFSPYFNQASEFGLNLSTAPVYSHIYPFSEGDLSQLVYSFVDSSAFLHSECGFEYSSEQANALYGGILKWRKCFFAVLRPLLCHQLLPDDALQLIDTRACAISRNHRLTGLEKSLMLLGDSVTPIKQIPRLLQSSHGSLHPNSIDEALQALLNKKLILIVGGFYLSLSVGGKLPALPRQCEFPGGAVDLDAIESHPELKNSLSLKYRDRVL